MQTPRMFAVLALVSLGCSYEVPTDDAAYHLACSSQSSCPQNWTCGSVWHDSSICSDPNRHGTRDGHILMSDGSVVWGDSVSEPNISFSCINEFTPTPALGQYCYQTAPMCGEQPCAPGQKCGYPLATGASFVLKCLDPSAFAPNDSGCGNCAPSYPHCYAVMEPVPNAFNYGVCSSQP